jgi:hypothetical protein
MSALLAKGENGFHYSTLFGRCFVWFSAAKRRGRHLGRPRKLTSHKLDRARQLIADGTENRAGAAALLGVHVKTLRRAVKNGSKL